MPIYLGVLSAISITIIMFKFGKGFYKKVIGYDWFFDVLITFGIPIAVGATYSGLVLGVITGLAMSGVFYVSRNIIGYSKLVRNGKWYKFKWVDYKGDWSTEVVTKVDHSSDSFYTKANDSIGRNSADAVYSEVDPELLPAIAAAQKKTKELMDDPKAFGEFFNAPF